MKIFSFQCDKNGICKIWRENYAKPGYVLYFFNFYQTEIVETFFEKNYKLKKISIGNWESELSVSFEDKADTAFFILSAYEGLEI